VTINQVKPAQPTLESDLVTAPTEWNGALPRHLCHSV
jgi:hypothetical protein